MPPDPSAILHQLEQQVKSCTKCGLACNRKNAVFGWGNPSAPLVLVGDAPGRDEDSVGLPFVGTGGIELWNSLRHLWIPTDQVYLCDVIKCHPPRNRRPQNDELESCLPYLWSQLVSIRPKAVVVMGTTAVRCITGLRDNIAKLRGQWFNELAWPILMTYHPTWVRKNGSQAIRDEFRSDLCAAWNFASH